MTEGPATAVQLREHLGPLWPDREPAALAHAVRCLLPTIQTPPRGLWGKGGNPAMSTADLWLDSPVDPDPSVDDPRPALPGRLRTGLGSRRPELVRPDPPQRSLRPPRPPHLHRRRIRPHRSTTSPTIDLPDEDLEVPTRFLPEYDNLLLSHADRTRWIDTPTRQQLTLQEVLTKGSVLHDGQAKALWKQTKTTKAQAILEIAPFTKLTPTARTAIEAEGHATS